jgi:hypothetical protein
MRNLSLLVAMIIVPIIAWITIRDKVIYLMPVFLVFVYPIEFAIYLKTVMKMQSIYTLLWSIVMFVSFCLSYTYRFSLALYDSQWLFAIPSLMIYVILYSILRIKESGDMMVIYCMMPFSLTFISVYLLVNRM